ncbi:MAG: YceI family protein [Saprospiraceae bacterium]
MKFNKFILSLIAIVAVANLAFTPANVGNVQGTKNVNTTKSTIAWKGYKVTGEHNGNVSLKSGALDFDNGVLTGGTFVIDMTSITCNDLEGEWKDKLVGHLKSDDFFGVATHPTAKFVITKAIPYGTEGAYKVVGNLTIKDITKEIKFNANVNGQNAEAKIIVDRSNYNVKYGSGSFFDNLGDKTIYDEFDLTINLVTE